jgi:BirA family transcriptional regulator, biotin operon repressor / biotin---[acetyl-CoA-carboxylase] ligase
MKKSRASALPETVILAELNAAEPEFVSGSALAKKLGMSRVAVWQHMEKLREQGFEFEAVRARGYRLISRPTGLSAALIQFYRRERTKDFSLQLLAEVDSTNDEAARQLADGKEVPFAIIAESQTKGRGRFGRPWHSESNGSLYVSFAFRPRLEPARMQMFTLWMGASICDLIANFCRTTPGLKWPNDLLFDGRKVGGMLTEARMDTDHIRDLVFGLGLNVNAPVGGWPVELVERAVSLAEHTRQPIDLNRLTAALIGRVLQAYERFVDGSYQKTFADLWNRYDVLRNRPVAVLTPTQRVAGIALGIDDEGSFLVRTTEGRTERFRAGEVTLEKPLR